MKLSTNLTLGGKPAHLVDHDIVLDLSAGGRAALTIEGTATKGQTLTVDTGYNGELRRWMVYVPSTYTGSKKVPLVLVMHGYTASMYAIATYSDASYTLLYTKYTSLELVFC